MEQKTLSAEPRRSFSNNFKLQMVKLALQPGASVARIAREHDINDNLLFKWLRLWQNEGRISRRLPVNTSSDTGVELFPVEVTLDARRYPVFYAR
ncbi:transposase [Escherichia coli]|nr:transposase [Escherichia coli]